MKGNFDGEYYKSITSLEGLKNQTESQVCDHLSGLIMDDTLSNRVLKVFQSEILLALSEQPSSLQMENTYIPELLDGTEEGIFLALDLGGTQFRVILMELHEGKIIREELKHYLISDKLRLGCGYELFDFLAKCLCEFVVEKNLNNLKHIPLGFTFSFPMKQHGIDSGFLITWTKTFDCPNVVNKDAVKILRESLHKFGQYNIEIYAILNDTTGTLLQGALLDHKTRIGMILGTGSNACYMERADRIQHWETERHGEKNVIIDIEWGAFGDNGVLDFIKTQFDRELDKSSLHTTFTFEKYIGGKYLGELQRIIMFHLVKQKLLFPHASLDHFPSQWKFDTDNVSYIEQDTVEGTTRNTEKILQELGYKYGKDYDEDDVKIIQYISALITIRAALLLSICLTEILNRLKDDEITIAIDGSLYKHHPRLGKLIEKFTSEFVPNKKIHLMLAEDGSGKGAGLAAAIASRIHRKLEYENSL